MVNVILPVRDMMTMDTRPGDLPSQGGCWGARAPVSPPASPTASPSTSPPAVGSTAGVSVIRLHHHHAYRHQDRVAERGDGARMLTSPSRMSPFSSSSECEGTSRGSATAQDMRVGGPTFRDSPGVATTPVIAEHALAAGYASAFLPGYAPGYAPGYHASNSYAHPARAYPRLVQDVAESICSLGDLDAKLFEQGRGALPPYPLLPWPAMLGVRGGTHGGHPYPLAAPPPPRLQARTQSANLKFGMDRILADDGCGPGARRGDTTVYPRLDCGPQMSIGELAAYPGLLAPTPLRIYGHVSDTTSSPPRAGSHRAQLSPLSTSSGGKRKRSWSRAVFSNLQRKGLEKRFQLQKYITKPDRRQLAATLGLTDAQVKVWFQNRRMKWRHTKESKQQAPLLDDLQDMPKPDLPPSK